MEGMGPWSCPALPRYGLQTSKQSAPPVEGHAEVREALQLDAKVLPESRTALVRKGGEVPRGTRRLSTSLEPFASRLLEGTIRITLQ